MKRLIISFFLALSMVAVLANGVFAAPDNKNAEVIVKATPSLVKISVSPDNYDFSDVMEGVDESTDADYFTIDNTSNKAIDIAIVCTGWSAASNAWTYGAAGTDTGRLLSTLNGTDYTAIPTGTPISFKSELAADTDLTWGLQLDTPSLFNYADEQSTTITLTATLYVAP